MKAPAIFGDSLSSIFFYLFCLLLASANFWYEYIYQQLCQTLEYW